MSQTELSLGDGEPNLPRRLLIAIRSMRSVSVGWEEHPDHDARIELRCIARLADFLDDVMTDHSADVLKKLDTARLAQEAGA